MTAARAPLLIAAALCAACAPKVAPPAPAPVAESRIVHAASGRDIGIGGLADRARGMDIVFVGESHGDPATHRFELALLAEIGARRPNVVVSLEFFERDVQDTVNAYLRGVLPESTFLATSRPPRRYATDYRALVELARARRWPVIASNVPRPAAAAVARAGLAVLDTMRAADRVMAAHDIDCPRDRYFDRFTATMQSHNVSGGATAPADSAAAAERNIRYYQAQCVKDETMAESIVRAWRAAGAGAVVVHYNGSFHSDRGLGTVERVRRRAPEARTLIVTAIPVDDVARADVTPYADRADYIVFVPTPRS